MQNPKLVEDFSSASPYKMKWINDLTSIFEIINQSQASQSQERSRLAFDHWMVAAVVPPIRAVTAVKCHCQLLFSGCHGLCEIHFLCLNTFCQARKDPNSNLFWPVFDRKHLTANGWTATSQMRHPSVFGLPTVFYYCFIFFTVVHSDFTPAVSLYHPTCHPYIDMSFHMVEDLFLLLYKSYQIIVKCANVCNYIGNLSYVTGSIFQINRSSCPHSYTHVFVMCLPHTSQHY